MLQKKGLTGSIGTGVGIMTHIRKYPTTTSTGAAYIESTWSDLVFPVKLELDHSISTSLRIGVTGGFYIHPDFPVLAYHFGPRLSYLLK